MRLKSLAAAATCRWPLRSEIMWWPGSSASNSSAARRFIDAAYSWRFASGTFWRMIAPPQKTRSDANR